MGDPVPPRILRGEATNRNSSAPEAAQFFEIEAFDDMDAAFDQKMYVNRHFRAGGELEGRGVAARGEDFTLAQPARGFKRRAGAAHLRDEAAPDRPSTAPSRCG